MSINGVWNITISTPIGSQAVVLELSESDGVITGMVKAAAETTPLLNPILTGNRLTWQQSITKPMRLNLSFDVVIEGDTLLGTSKAGMLPSSKITGSRRCWSRMNIPSISLICIHLCDFSHCWIGSPHQDTCCNARYRT